MVKGKRAKTKDLGMQESTVKLTQKEDRFILTCLKCGENHELWTDSERFVRETFERFKERHRSCQSPKEMKVIQKSLFETEPLSQGPKRKTTSKRGRRKKTTSSFRANKA